MKFCSNCNREYDDSLNFCSQCGGVLTVKPKIFFCHVCGKPIGECVGRFCPYCGHQFGHTQYEIDGDNVNGSNMCVHTVFTFFKKHLNVSFHGRRGRIDALLYGIIFGVINFGFMCLFVGSNSIILKILTLLLIILISLLLISNIIKRVHDFNKSGIWLIGAYLVVCVIGGVISTIDYTIGSVYGFFAQWWVYFIKGTKGTNKYGDEPESIIF